MKRLESLWIHGLLAAVAGLLLAWSNLHTPWARPLVDAVGVGLSWPERPALELRMVVQSFSSWVGERKTLRQRLADLETENLTLRRRLESLAEPVPPRSGALVGARVTLRYPEAWWSEVRVDRGSRDGVVAGAPALSEGFLIGTVSRLGADYAWVRLLTSSESLLATVVEETRDLGVLAGDDQGNVWLQYIPVEKRLDRNMRLATALVGEAVPPGIPVGRVWSPGRASGGFQPYRVVLGAHLTQLYTLEILVAPGGAP